MLIRNPEEQLDYLIAEQQSLESLNGDKVRIETALRLAFAYGVSQGQIGMVYREPTDKVDYE